MLSSLEWTQCKQPGQYRTVDRQLELGHWKMRNINIAWGTEPQYQ